MKTKKISKKTDLFKKKYFAKNVVRDHDSAVYTKEKRKQVTKENFKFILKQTEPHFRKFDRPEIVDVGCATGDFLYFLGKKYPEVNLNGVDLLKELLVIGKKEVPNASFFRGDICIKKTLPKKKFDIAYLIALHNAFDNIDLWLDNFLSLIKNGGHGFIFSFFNADDYDVLVKVRKSGTNDKWQAGWNVLSKKTFSDFLKKRKLKHKFIPWTIEKDIKKKTNDPLRSWTLKTSGGKRIVRNTAVIHDFYLLKIYK
jgi:ubiquinone/menaquinone biosynthesis C-methylase UbiE